MSRDIAVMMGVNGLVRSSARSEVKRKEQNNRERNPHHVRLVIAVSAHAFSGDNVHCGMLENIAKFEPPKKGVRRTRRQKKSRSAASAKIASPATAKGDSLLNDGNQHRQPASETNRQRKNKSTTEETQA